MFLLEINEFNPELMTLAAERLGAAHLKRLLALKHTKTETDEKQERFGLDPWVQWVSIHTGRPAAEHGVAHLGDVPALTHPQLWETLSSKGWRCGVWGAMNASRGAGEHCTFFFPDPWTFSESAYPPELNDLLAFPRYYSKNYGELSAGRSLASALRLLKFCLRPRIALVLLPRAPKLLASVLRHGVSEHMLFALFDVVNAILFAHYYRRERPDFGLLFMNSLAHLQHHKWTVEDGLSEEMQVAFGLFDYALGILFDVIDSSDWVVANAFSQYCSVSENEFLYRQRNPEGFLRAVGIVFDHVEQAMTNDGHVFFSSAEAASHAAEVLREAHIDGSPAFHVDLQLGANKLFYQFVIWRPLEADARLCINGREPIFFELFEKITQRTGSHTSLGDVFSGGMQLPDLIHNHELHDHVIRSFSTKVAI
jgi:hypothetical protein